MIGNCESCATSEETSYCLANSIIERLTDPGLAGHLVFVYILKCWQQTEKNLIPLWRPKKIQLQANKTNK